MNKMKDFIYLDTDSVSSISAQLFEGNITEMTDEKTVQRGNNITDKYGSNESKSTGGRIGTHGTGINGKKANQTFEGKSMEFFNNDTFKNGVKKAYDDFLYNKIFDILNNDDQIHPIQNSNQFDFVHITGIYTVLDIDTSAKIFDTDLLRQLPHLENEHSLPTIQSLQAKFNASEKYLNNPGSKKLPKDFDNVEELKDFYDTFKGTSIMSTFNKMTIHLSKVFSNKIIFNKENEVLIGDKDHLRLPGDTISLADEISLEGFGRKITKTNKLSSVIDFEDFEFDKNDFVTKGTQGMLMIFLSSVLNLEKNDTFDIIQPIGLEFSKVSR